MLGEIGKGHVIAFNILNVGRFKLGAMCVGGARLSLENAIGYAKQRKAFNKVIADFGLVREKLANMAVRVYVGEAVVYRTVGMMDGALTEVDKSGADATKETRKAIEEYAVECSIIKVWGSEMVDYVVDETRADLRRLRLCRRVSGRARLPRCPHQPHLRRHQRNQPAHHYWIPPEARDDWPVAADAGDQEADG